MIKSIVKPTVRSIVKGVLGEGENPYPNSFWNDDGSINCSGIYYCNQAVPCFN